MSQLVVHPLQSIRLGLHTFDVALLESLKPGAVKKFTT